jgi:hypothetical protein
MIKRYKSDKKWIWKRGDGVSIDAAPELKGIVVEPGDEVSGIKFLDGTFQYYTNRHLVPEDDIEQLRREKKKLGKE